MVAQRLNTQIKIFDENIFSLEVPCRPMYDLKLGTHGNVSGVVFVSALLAAVGGAGAAK